MPYQILNKAGGYFVCKESNPKQCLSLKPHKTLEKAQRQMSAVIISEAKKKRKNKIKKKK
jgi:hypothetical protein